MTRLEKVRVLKERTGIQTVSALIDWLLNVQIEKYRKMDTPRARRESQCKSTGEK